jgi:pyruvate dehydrogenase E2 component (dihydrolipoamide acetyltransferase)
MIAGTGSTGSSATPELPDFSQWGEIVTEPLAGVRRATARSMSTAWAIVPHVTQFDRADISQLESMRRRFNQRPEPRGRKLTLTAIVIKMSASALRQFPRFNASLDMAREAIILKKYVHVGVAVDTGRGLLVPVIRDVDRKSLVQVAGELDELASRARDKKLGPDEMSGASFTVSNLGGLGTTYFSPIVNWPQVAILGVGRAERQAVYEEGGFQPRLMLPLAISYDHRLIDGADAARFLRWLAEALEQPLLLLADE